MISHAIRDNIAALQQGIDLLSRLSTERYTQCTPACFNSTAGAHLRHVIEHYFSFFHGMQTGEIDYEARARDSLIETDPAYALAQLESVCDRLQRLTDAAVLHVRSESEQGKMETVWCTSSTLRELEFLLSHTVHHYALIGVICQLAGQSMPKNFGMAPSTLRHLQTQALATCAR